MGLDPCSRAALKSSSSNANTAILIGAVEVTGTSSAAA
jgi:hypothetical protein